MMNANKKTILVVDDEVYIREIITYDLQRAGYNVIEAPTGKDAFALLQTTHVDLVLSDVRMPSGNGIELLDWIRGANPSDPSFIFMTAFSDVSSNDALNLGAEAFLRKPVEKVDLLDSVSAALIPRSERWAQEVTAFEGARCIDATSISPTETEAKFIALGQGGMFLAMDQGYPTCFEVVEFRIFDENLGSLSGFGKVRWIRHEPTDDMPSGVGIEFVALPEPSLNRVLDWLKKNKPRAYIPLGLENL